MIAAGIAIVILAIFACILLIFLKRKRNMNQEARLFGSKEGASADSQAWNDKQHGIQINK